MTSRFISDETLLGYLLGALDEGEQAQVREAILRDRHLQARLNALQNLSIPTLEENEFFEPPGSMVSRVMSDLASDSTSCAPEGVPVGPESEATLPTPRPLAVASDGRECSRRGSWLDTGMSFVAATVGICLVAPAILQSREVARTTQCATGLMTLGQHIRDFAFRNQNNSVPEVPTEGPLAFAGVYAIHLNDSGLLEEPRILWCPNASDYRMSVVRTPERHLPSAMELQKLSANRRRIWQHIAGGSYAYNLGVMINDLHQMPTLDDSADTAILADAPSRGPGAGQAWSFRSHRGTASNVLYRDGRVVLLKLEQDYVGPDHPYLNRQGIMAAGNDREDSALGASYLTPLGTNP